MSLITGTVLAIDENDGLRMATVNVRGARVRVALNLLPGAQIGETILIESGIAIAHVHNREGKEQQPNVPGNPG